MLSWHQEACTVVGQENLSCTITPPPAWTGSKWHKGKMDPFRLKSDANIRVQMKRLVCLWSVETPAAELWCVDILHVQGWTSLGQISLAVLPWPGPVERTVHIRGMVLRCISIRPVGWFFFFRPTCLTALTADKFRSSLLTILILMLPLCLHALKP